ARTALAEELLFLLPPLESLELTLSSLLPAPLPLPPLPPAPPSPRRPQKGVSEAEEALRSLDAHLIIATKAADRIPRNPPAVQVIPGRIEPESSTLTAISWARQPAVSPEGLLVPSETRS
ncbi:hypothetical protein T484DRAFT_1797570, partial [Baffinella frigidus]